MAKKKPRLPADVTTCPDCGKDAVIHSLAERGVAWHCSLCGARGRTELDAACARLERAIITNKGWPVVIRGRVAHLDSPDFNGDPGHDTDEWTQRRVRGK